MPKQSLIRTSVACAANRIPMPHDAMIFLRVLSFIEKIMHSVQHGDRANGRRWEREEKQKRQHQHNADWAWIHVDIHSGCHQSHLYAHGELWDKIFGILQIPKEKRYFKLKIKREKKINIIKTSSQHTHTHWLLCNGAAPRWRWWKMFPQNYMHNVDSDRMKMNEVYKWLIDVPYKTSETGSRAHHTHSHRHDQEKRRWKSKKAATSCARHRYHTCRAQNINEKLCTSCT